MKITVKTKLRMFDFWDITEKEARVIRQIFNSNDEYLRKKLNGDKAYWEDLMGEDEAVQIAIQLREGIFKEVDEG